MPLLAPSTSTSHLSISVCRSQDEMLLQHRRPPSRGRECLHLCEKLNCTLFLLGSKLPTLGRRLPAIHNRILGDCWLLAVDDEPVRECPHLNRAL